MTRIIEEKQTFFLHIHFSKYGMIWIGKIIGNYLHNVEFG